MITYVGSCELCQQCHVPGCTATVCLGEDPAALMECCGGVECEGCRDWHECSEPPC